MYEGAVRLCGMHTLKEYLRDQSVVKSFTISKSTQKRALRGPSFWVSLLGIVGTTMLLCSWGRGFDSLWEFGFLVTSGQFLSNLKSNR